MKPYVFVTLALLSFSTYAQSAFQVGEKLKYDVYYKVAFVWIDAAYVKLEVEDTVYQSNKYYKFKSMGSSKPSYDWIFRVRDYFSSISNKETLYPLQFQRNTSEGSYKVDLKYDFSYPDQKAYTSGIRNKRPVKDTLSIDKSIRDLLSSAYHFRNLDFTKFKEGDTITVRAIVDNEVSDNQIIYMGTEQVKHKNKKRYEAYKFRGKGVEGSMFDKNDYVSVWFSKDEYKIPIKVEAGIVVGKVLVYLNSAEVPNESPYAMLKEF